MADLQTELRTQYNRILRGQAPALPGQYAQPPAVTADQNYLNAHPDAVVGHVAPDRQNMVFDTQTSRVTVGGDHQTTTVDTRGGRVTARPDHTLTVTPEGGQPYAVNNPRLADQMVGLGAAAVGARTLPVMSARDAQTLTNDALAAMNSPQTPPGAYQQPRRR